MSEVAGLIEATPESLGKALARRPVLWVGAGASIAAGHASTEELVAEMVRRADDPIDPALPYEEVADAFVRSEGKAALADLLQHKLAAPRPLVDLHRAIARAAGAGSFSAIVTTNYDDLLERALSEAGVRYVLQSLEDNAEVDDPEAVVRLLKLHGSIGNWRRTVLAASDYREFFRRYPFLERQLDELMRRRSLLFVGCSLQDRRLTEWLGGLDDEAAAGLKPWRALMTRRAWGEALAASSSLRRATLRPLVLENHAALTPLWLEVAPAAEAPKAEELALAFELSPSGLEARLGEDSWRPQDPLADEELTGWIDRLRDLGSRPLPTDDRGVPTAAAASATALLRELAGAVGERLTAVLSDTARERLRAGVTAGSTGRPTLLRLQVRVAAGIGELTMATPTP